MTHNYVTKQVKLERKMSCPFSRHQQSIISIIIDITENIPKATNVFVRKVSRVIDVKLMLFLILAYRLLVSTEFADRRIQTES